MKMLLKAAFSSGKHYKWLIYSFFALFAVTIANQLELLTLGVIINSASPTVSGGINDPIHLFLDKIKAYFVFSDY